MYCRKISTPELSAVCKLYLEEESIELPSEDFVEYITKAKRVYQYMLGRDSYTLGCFSDSDELLGVININKNLDYYPGYVHKPYVHLETFIVAKAHQNKGVGTFLFVKAIERIKNEGCTYVIIQSDNEYVQKIARKAGLSSSLRDMRFDYIQEK